MKKLFLVMLVFAFASSLGFAGVNLPSAQLSAASNDIVSSAKPYAPSTVKFVELNSRAPYTLYVGGGSWDEEITWEITTLADVVLFSGIAGTFPVTLDDGTYRFYGHDSYGDGWNGAYATLTDVDGHEAFSETMADGTDFTFDFVVPVPQPMYSLYVGGSSWEYEMSWEIHSIVTRDVLYSGLAGTFPIGLWDDTYLFVGLDDYGDGWDAGYAELVDADLNVMFNWTFASGTMDSFEFAVPTPLGNPLGDGCDNPFMVELPYFAPGTTTDNADTGGARTSADEWYQFTIGLASDVEISTCFDNGYTFDTYLSLWSGNCVDMINYADDNCDFYWGTATFTTTLMPGTYIACVEGYSSAGDFDLLIEATPLPPMDPICPENTLFGQLPVGPDGVWSFATSDEEGPYVCADDYVAPSTVFDLHFWGLMLFYDAGWNLCYDDPMNFNINFHYDNAGVPGDIACTYNAFVSPQATNILYADFYMLWYFSIDMLEPGCDLGAGWISIQSTLDDNCWFLWANSESLNGSFGVQDAGDGWGDLGYDLAFCLTGDTATEIEIPQSIQLDQNYPNPFNPTTTINYSLTQPEQVNLSVYNMTGGLVTTLVNSEVVAGSHSVTFDATDLPSGLYFYTLNAGSFTDTRKMVVVK
jgi:hypothetical protein